MATQAISGAQYMLRGLGLLSKPGIRPFVLIPLIVNVLVFSLLIWLGVSQFESWMNRMLPDPESWFHWLRWILWPIFAIALLLVVFYTFTVIANLIAAPFNGLLAEKVEAYLGGAVVHQPGGVKQLMKDLLPALLSELRKLSYFLIRAIPLLLLFLIPVVQIAAPFLWLLFNAWYLTLEYGDYPMANHNLGFKEQHQRLKRVRLDALSFGGTLTLMMMIPILNFVAMPAAVAGATIFWRERLSQL
ncbi:MAG: sulfate transporter CysZ [Candidatus Thiodiazotropha sp.]